MALAFAFAQVFSRQLRDLDISLTNAFTGLFGFIILLIVSFFIEGDTIETIKLITVNSWFLISYQAIVVSLGAHLMMFYLYKFYTVGQIFPSYSLFPIFGIALSFLIFVIASPSIKKDKISNIINPNKPVNAFVKLTSKSFNCLE